MRSKLALLLMAVMLVPCLLAGCGGISQEQYDKVLSQFNEAQQKIEEAQGNISQMETDMNAALADLEAVRDESDELRAQVSSLILVGATKAETAANIVRNYHETHVYSTIDMFTCGDMASEVWNMLKAHDIGAVIVVGNKDAVITDILASNHAWVLAEVGSGEYLTLETTAGTVVTEGENPLYYRGWTFDSPSKLKSHTTLVREYNVRIAVHNDIVDEDNEVIAEYNRTTSQTKANELKAVHEKLAELLAAQESELTGVKAEIDSLATALQ